MNDALKELESSRRDRDALERCRLKTTLQLPTAAAADVLTTPRSRAPSTGACSTSSTRRSVSMDRATCPPRAARAATIAETDELLFAPASGGARPDLSERLLRRKLEEALRARDDLKYFN